MNPSTAQATVLVDELIACDVTDAVLCPGSRNAPLSMALHAADAAGRLRLHVRIDERTAGFLALGLARGSGRPVPVATTSGTAVANLHPAVLEAHHGRVPLIVLSADRPPQLHGVGANQTVDQRELFGTSVHFRHEFAVATRSAGQNAYWRSLVCRALAHARGLGAPPGPVHLNVPLTEPLLPDGGGDGAVDLASIGDWPEPLVGRGGPWTVIPVSHPGDPEWAGPWPGGPLVAGPAVGERCLMVVALDAVAPALGQFVPVVAEAGGLAGSTVLRHGVDLLATPAVRNELRPDRVIVIGRPTLYRQIGTLLADPGVLVDVLDDPRAYADPRGVARMVGMAHSNWSFGSGGDPWLDAWRAADAAAGGAVQSVLAGRLIDSSPVLARTLAAALPNGTTLVVGSSQPPRDLGRFAEPRDGVRIVANRGVAGIDGTISTAVGAALAAQNARQAGSTGRTVALLGDLTFLHDLTGLAIGPHEPRPDLTIVVANNDGGGIFTTLEPGEPAHSRAFERVFGTPIGAELAPIARGLGVDHVLVRTKDELAEAVRHSTGGIRVVEVPVIRTDLRELLQAVTVAVNAALADLRGD